MSTILLLAEIQQTERALSRARALRTTLEDLNPDEARRALLSAAELTISSLQDRLSAARYAYRKASEVAA